MSVGSIFPILYLVLFQLGAIEEFPTWGMYIWPSSLLLMATDGAENNLRVVATVIAVSLTINALLWVGVGLICFHISDYLRAKFSRTVDK